MFKNLIIVALVTVIGCSFGLGMIKGAGDKYVDAENSYQRGYQEGIKDATIVIGCPDEERSDIYISQYEVRDYCCGNPKPHPHWDILGNSGNFNKGWMNEKR
jgi:hypothetical protein